MRIYSQRNLDAVGERCREIIGLLKGPGWPPDLALPMTARLSEALVLIVDAEMRLGEQRDVRSLLARAHLAVRRAHRRLRGAYQQRQVPGAAFKQLGGELLRVLETLRAIRKGLLAAPPSPEA